MTDKIDEINKDSVWKHKVHTCYLYKVKNFGKIQTNNIWVDAIIYVREFDNPQILYIRSKEEFLSKFINIRPERMNHEGMKGGTWNE